MYNVMVMWGQSFSFVLALFLSFAAVAQAAPVDSLKQNYTNAMADYRREFAQYDVNRKLYQRNQTETYLAPAMTGAQATFTARQNVMVAFNAYLAALLDEYVATNNPTMAATLKTQLQNQVISFQSISGNVSGRDAFYRADDDFSRFIAANHETTYASFAQIYYAELAAIQQEFTQLYQSQNQRILTEAKNEVERETKKRTLDQTERSLASLKTQLDSAQPLMASINNREQYFTFRAQLNEISTQLEASLKLYANLE